MNKSFGILTICACLSTAAWGSQKATLSWNPAADLAVTGYALYYGSVSNGYSSRIDVGTNTTVTLSGLQEGKTNYFAVAAYNATGVEGIPSSQITYLVPGLLIPTGTPAHGGQMGMTFPVSSGHWYEIQASSNLTSWATISQTATATSNAWVQFQDPQSSTMSKRFYRLLMH